MSTSKARSAFTGTVARQFKAHRRWLLVLVALLFGAEQVFFLLSGGSQGSATPLTAPAHASLRAQLIAAVSNALGPSDRGVRRFALTQLAADPHAPGRYALTITWAINGDISLGSVSAGAQLDVYLVLSTLYGAHLPVGAVRMNGTFADRTASGHSHEVPVLEVGLQYATARQIDWADMDAATVWPLLHRYLVRPGFECGCQE